MARDEMPQEIQSLIAQCEANVSIFDNDQMSAALHFAEECWRKLTAEANVSALAAELCRKHNDADRVAVWEIHDVEALIRRQFRESTPSPVIEGYDREAELLKQLAIVQGERDELAKHFYDARLIASNHAEHVSRLKQKLAALEDERDWLKTCTNTRAYGKLQAENDQLRTTVTSLREACEGASQALQSPVRQWDERNNRERQRDFGRTDEPYMIQVARSVIAQLATALQSSEA